MAMEGGRRRVILLLGWTDDMHRPAPWGRVTAAAEVRTDHDDGADVYICI